MTGRSRWVILALGTFAQTATSSFLYGIPMLVPRLRTDGLTLVGASLVVSAPVVGVLLTLVLWGAAADRYGERVVIASGVGAAAVLLGVAALTHGAVGLSVLLLLAGAFGASVNAASGRMVMGWFPVHERGLAMGTRQTAQPLGVAIAALGLPPLAHAHGAHLALLFPAALCGVAALGVAVFVADPPRPELAGAEPSGSPYRGSSTLARIHFASAMLVVPQFAVSTFMLAYLVGERHWVASVAGRVVFVAQLAGAAGRVASGIWSDRVRSRLRPMRQLGVASASVMLMIALGAATGWWLAIVAFGIGAVVTVADNGLAYTSVAEIAGRAWSGRALGVQNTVQNVAAVATAPLLALLIGAGGYGVGFAAVAVFALLAVPLTPVGAESSRSKASEGASV